MISTEALPLSKHRPLQLAVAGVGVGVAVAVVEGADEAVWLFEVVVDPEELLFEEFEEEL